MKTETIDTIKEMLKAAGMPQAENIPIEDIVKAGDELMKKMPTVNIIVTGKTGVGKSTLINEAFRGHLANLAKVGMGRPVTKESCWLPETPSDDIPLRIYDTVGLELSDHTRTSTVETIKTMIQKRREIGDSEKIIHCVWYCVLDASNRLEPAEEVLIRELSEEQVPVILVLTQASKKKHAQEFQKKILEDYPALAAKEICIVLAQDEEEPPTKAYGMDHLAEVTSQYLEDEGLRDAWCNMQRVSLKLKRERALQIVESTIAKAGLIGASPVPCSDAALLVPLQGYMLVQITNVFGFPVTKKWAVSLAASLMGTAGTSMVGKMIVSSLLKLIPIGGTIAGGALNGATAGALTYALGTAYVRFLEAIYDEGRGAETDWMNDRSKAIFSDFLKDAMKWITPENIEKLIKGVITFADMSKKY